jgi:hypothetical protein
MTIAQKGTAMSTDSIKVKHGVLLIILLAFLLITQLWIVVFGFTTWQSLVEHAQKGQGPVLFQVVFGVVAIAALIGIWFWRRLAVYLLAGVAVIGIAVDVWSGLPSYALLVRLALLAALGWAIKQRWDAFR